ncbi:uncharacterized protein LOC113305759 [Papaver somniferum]|uniref:uncharacterized protein LOC113305759 n=1 Tax=Papaver somniferum TaxID=3469 RepID=UPI000E702050|nr:uncharacterized protein LOC113305759 [Papaver somniferum]
MGDFNEVLEQHENKGGRLVTNGQVRIFNNFINYHGLIDLGFQGDTFTWTNNQTDGKFIMERLDRGLDSQQWLDNNPQALLRHLPRIGSDHAPLLLNERAMERRGTKNFRVEHLWFLHPQMKDIVINAWQQNFSQLEAATAGQKMLTKMKETAITLQQWNKQTFGHLPELLKEAEFQIQLA